MLAVVNKQDLSSSRECKYSGGKDVISQWEPKQLKWDQAIWTDHAASWQDNRTGNCCTYQCTYGIALVIRIAFWWNWVWTPAFRTELHCTRCRSATCESTALDMCSAFYPQCIVITVLHHYPGQTDRFLAINYNTTK